jgi:transcription termination/antitermination protein NusA
MNYDITESFAQMVREKGIDKDILAGIIEDIFSMMVRKKYGLEAQFEVIVNMEKGHIEIYLEREIVEKVEDPNTQIDIKSVRKQTDEPLEVGEEYVEMIRLDQFDRRLVVSAKQSLNQRIKEIEKEITFAEYNKMVGEIIVGDIYQIRRNEILVIHNKKELIMPKSEQIPKERYKKGDSIRAVIAEVRRTSTGSPQIIISRASPLFLHRLFELEIPEIPEAYGGVIEIKGIVREPGDRAKVAVESHDDRVDAVGACVGMKGTRIHAIVRELNNENIDVINFSGDPTVFITRALSPAKLKDIRIDRQNKTAVVTVDIDQVPMLIGKNGQNIRLASKLTGYELKVKKIGGMYDIDLSEFTEELEEIQPGVYMLFTEAGFSSALEVIEAYEDNKIQFDNLEADTLKRIVDMLREGLEEAEEETEEAEEETEEAEEETEEAEEETEEKSEAGTAEAAEVETEGEKNDPDAVEAEVEEPADENKEEESEEEEEETEEEEEEPAAADNVDERKTSAADQGDTTDDNHEDTPVQKSADMENTDDPSKDSGTP